MFKIQWTFIILKCPHMFIFVQNYLHMYIYIPAVVPLNFYRMLIILSCKGFKCDNKTWNRCIYFIHLQNKNTHLNCLTHLIERSLQKM